MRTKKAIYNFIFDAGPQLIISFIGLFRIKIILDLLGNDTLAIYQLFGQLLAYVSLAELGITGAVMFSLYKPLYKKDKNKINSLLSGAKYVFNIIGVIMLIIGLILMFNIGIFIKETALSFTYIKICFFLMVIANIITYFVSARVILFDADQNKYKYSRITQTLLVLKTLLELFVIYYTHELIYMLIVGIVYSIVQNIIIIYLSKKNYSYLNLKAKKDMSFWKKTKDLIPHKIGMLISYNIDVVIISKILGSIEVVTYTAYIYIVNTLVNVLGKISTASLSGIGNLLLDNKKEAYNRFLEYNSFVFFLASIICVPLYSALSNFVSLWYGTQYVVNDITCLLFVSLVLYSIIRNVLNIYGNAAGLFKETLICVYIEIPVNLILSLILVNYIGIAGVLVGTISSYIISEYIIKPFILNKHIFKDKICKYYKDNFIYIVLIIINLFLVNYIESLFNYNNLLMWFIYSFIIFIINFILMIIYYKLIKKDDFMNRLIPKKWRKNEKV